MFLKVLIEEFASPTENDDSFSLLPLSASGDQAGSVTTPRPVLMDSLDISMSSAVQLERVGDATLDGDAVEELLTASSASQSPSAPRSRITAFLQPDSRRNLEADSRRGSLVHSSARATPRFTVEHKMSKEGSSGSDESVGPTSVGTPANVNMITSRVLDNWPDPYGISPDESFGPRALPLLPPAEPRSQKASPMLQPMIMPDSALRRSPLKEAQPSTSLSGKINGFDPEVWATHRRNRCQTFLQWWQAYVDDVRIRLFPEVLC